jgi:hypothetical protein
VSASQPPPPPTHTHHLDEQVPVSQQAEGASMRRTVLLIHLKPPLHRVTDQPEPEVLCHRKARATSHSEVEVPAVLFGVCRIACPHAVVRGVDPPSRVVKALQTTVRRAAWHWRKGAIRRTPGLRAARLAFDIPPAINRTTNQSTKDGNQGREGRQRVSR